jgi:hypothetical protein
VEAGQVDPRLGHQCLQPDDEVEVLEDDVRRVIAVWRLQLVLNVAIRGERQAFFCD